MQNKINYKKTKKRIKGGSAPPPVPGPAPNLSSRGPPRPPAPAPNLSSRGPPRPPAPAPNLYYGDPATYNKNRTPLIPPAPTPAPNLITNKTKKVNTSQTLGLNNLKERSKEANNYKKQFFFNEPDNGTGTFVLKKNNTIKEIEKIYTYSNLENNKQILINVINNEIVSSKAPIKKISFKGLGDVNFINPKVSDLEINSIEKPDNREKLLLIGPSKVTMEIKYKLSKSSVDMFNYKKITIVFIYNSLGYDKNLKCEIENIETITFNDDNQPSRLTARDLKKILNKEFICNIFKNTFANIKKYLLKDVDNKLKNLIKKQGANIPESKCKNKTGQELRKCQQDYDKTMFDKKMERIAANTSMEKIFRLYLGVFYGETTRVEDWKKYKNGKFFLFDLDSKILNTLLKLHPNFDIERHKLESEKKNRLGFRLIQDAINNKVRGIPYQEQINKMTFFEHFVFVLCSKRSFASGKIRSAERRGRDLKNKKKKPKGVSKFDIINSDPSQLESIKTSKAKADMFKYQDGGMASALKYALDTKAKKFAGLKGERAYGRTMSKSEIEKLQKEGVIQAPKEYKSLSETRLSKQGKRLLGEECDSIDDDNERLKCCNKVDIIIDTLEKKKRTLAEDERLKQLKKEYDDYKTRCNSKIKDSSIREKGCSKIKSSNKKVLCNNMFVTNDQERRMNCEGIINDEVLKMRCIQGHTQKAMTYKRKNLDVLQVERIFKDKFRKIMTATLADKKGKCIGLNLEKVCCSGSKDEAKKKMCKDAQEIIKQQDPNTTKNKCESLKNNLDRLYCYKDLYDETGREKFKGMVKFLCRKNFCVKGLEDDVCLEFNTCKDLKPRFRDIFRDSREFYRYIKKLLELGDIEKLFASLRLPSQQGVQQYFGSRAAAQGAKEQTLVLKELIKFKKDEKKLLKKQYNLFKKTADGKEYSRLQKQKKKTQKKAISRSSKGLLKKRFTSQKSKNKFVQKAKNNKNKAESAEKELEAFVEKICKEAPGERCELAKKAKEYQDIGDNIKMIKFVRKQEINEAVKKAVEKMNKPKSVQNLSKEKPLQSEASKATNSKNTKKANAPKKKVSSKIKNIQSKLK